MQKKSAALTAVTAPYLELRVQLSVRGKLSPRPPNVRPQIDAALSGVPSLVPGLEGQQRIVAASGFVHLPPGVHAQRCHVAALFVLRVGRHVESQHRGVRFANRGEVTGVGGLVDNDSQASKPRT